MRQVTWIGVAGLLVCTSAAVTRASLRPTRTREPAATVRFDCTPTAAIVQPEDSSPDDDPLDSPSSLRSAARHVPAPTLEAQAASRAPTTTRNQRAPQRLKIPPSHGEDVPAH